MLCFSFVLVYFVVLELPGISDISLKIGTISHLLLLILAVKTLDLILQWRPIARAAGILLITIVALPGFMTWAMDAYNSGDVKNKKFTTYLNPDDAEVLLWMDRFLPANARILCFSSNYSKFSYDIVPPFGARAVYLGDRIYSLIFQSSSSEQGERERKILRMYRADSAGLAQGMAADGIDYVFLPAKDPFNVPEVRNKLTQPYFTS